MGRWSTGAITVGQCLQLRIGTFTEWIKAGNLNRPSTIEWKDGGQTINFCLKESGSCYVLELTYTVTQKGQANDINYEIRIVGQPSNLGIGTVYYFVCPFRHEWCRVLYMGYGSHHFKSREAYRHRIYYPSQISSKLDKSNDTYHRLNRQLEKLRPKHPKKHYKGIVTKAQQRIQRLEIQIVKEDEKRLEVLHQVINKMTGYDPFATLYRH